ncbi:MAG: hypothetical protein EB060_11040 [Proteobacteria bacterium]|nr:hypothetical protein [Pseudomonadota bacterium]
MTVRIRDNSSGKLVTSFNVAAQNTFCEDAEFDYLRPFNLSVSGTWAGTVTLQRSFNNGSTWLDVYSVTANVETVVDSPETGVLWRLGIKTGNYTSGTAVCRLSQ